MEIQNVMTLKAIIRFTVVASVFMALLARASVLPDPCFSERDSCCSHEAPAHSCSTICCAGIVATPEPEFRLDRPNEHRPIPESLVSLPEFTPPDLLIRPPISA